MELPNDFLSRLIQLHPRLDTVRSAAADTLAKIAVLHEPVSYAELYADYIANNQPVILGQWATAGWPSRRLWCNGDTEIQWNYLTEHFGDETVPVADCTEQVSYEHSKLQMKFAEFVCYLKNTCCDNPDNSKLLYLKDWHFQRDFPSSDAYTTPVYFQSDWLNEYWDGRNDCHDDYRFLYFGPRGSWTPFHADVLRSFSWSANVFGKKKWILCPAGVEEKLKDVNGHLPTAIDTATLDERDVKYFEVIQNAGEVLFVPSGWYHQVFNLTLTQKWCFVTDLALRLDCDVINPVDVVRDLGVLLDQELSMKQHINKEVTLSINHNWINAANIDITWKFIEDSLAAVEHEIEEHRHTMDNWIEHCQLFLRADIGIDVVEFFNLLYAITVKRLSTNLGAEQQSDLQHDACLALQHDASLASDSNERRNQVIYDVFRILKVLQEMLRKPKVVEILEIGGDRLKSGPFDFMKRLHTTVNCLLKHFTLSSE